MPDPATAPVRTSPSLTVRLFRPLGRLWLKATGWQIEGEMPDFPKFIIVGAPHTSNWDLPYTLAAAVHYGVRAHWMGKNSIFKPPFGGLMRWLGGIPVDRSQANNAVSQMVETFAARDRFVLVIPPEGTRGKVTRWKTGFYHIAVGAKVPLALGFLDYKRKAAGIAKVYYPTGNLEADLAEIQAFYATVTPRHPNRDAKS
ncbi:MAG: lysophospholipid acyltransferase family protein [Hyphomicrobiaceae bacterium]